MKNDLRKDIPVEMEEAILGDEMVEIGDEPLGLESMIEEVTGVSLSPYSQQKMVMSNQISFPSSNAPMFEEIFGEGSIGADQTAAISQSRFIRSNQDTLLDDHTRLVPDPDPTPRPVKSKESIHNRLIAKVEEMASLALRKTPPDLAILTKLEGVEPPTPEMLERNKTFFESLAAAMKKSRVHKFLMDKLQEEEADGMTEKEHDELDRLRVIDTEIFDYAW